MSAAPTSPLPPLMRVRDVTALLRVSRVTLWQMRRRGDFPPPLRISTNVIAWREADVRAWLARRPAA